LPYESPRTKAIYHLYVIRVKNRDQLQTHVAQAGIMTQAHYPTPLHLQKAYASLGHKEGDFPATEEAATEILSLPMYPQLELDQQKRVVQEVVKSLAGEAVGSRNPSLVTCESDSRAD
jgi:dTDP-4-amino-4,6-dideoxygalactose transaminase